MILDDIIEYVEVGQNKVKCLRLTKYNPDYVPRVKPMLPDDLSLVTHALEDLCKSRLSCSEIWELMLQYDNIRYHTKSPAVSHRYNRSRTRL